MHSFLLSLVALSSIAVAQTPQGFAPEAPKSLAVTFADGTAVSPAGFPLAQSATAKQPSIKLEDGTDPTVQFMQFIVDIDVPAQDGSKTTFLHLAQSNLNAAAASNTTGAASNGTASAAGNATSPAQPAAASAAATTAPYANTTSPAASTSSNSSTITISAAVASNVSLIEASYLQPAPPAGSGPHRYVVMLFEQPSNFTVPSDFASKLSTANTDPQSRVGFDMNAFVAAAGLGVPIGGTFFTVENTTASAAAASSSSSNGTTTATESGNGTAAASESGSGNGTTGTGTAAAAFQGGASSRYESASRFGLVLVIGVVSIGFF